MAIQLCTNCRTKVVPTLDGTCPKCLTDAEFEELPNYLMSDPDALDKIESEFLDEIPDFSRLEDDAPLEEMYEINCERCGSSNVARYLYGLPNFDDEELLAKFDLGEVVFKGDNFSIYPTWHCNDCRHDWPKPDAAPLREKDRQLKEELKKVEENRKVAYQKRIDKADLRGIKEISANIHGFARCPMCEKTFPANYTSSLWDGERHHPCLTRLNITGDANFYYTLGLDWIKKGRNDKAIAAYTQAIELGWDDLEVYYKRGIALGETGELDKAIEDLSMAIRLDPQYAMAYYKRGLYRGDKGDLDNAISDFNEALRFDSRDEDAYYSRGFMWKRKDNFGKALADLNEAIRLNPKHSKAFSLRGNIWEMMGNKAKAEADFNKAIELVAKPPLKQDGHSETSQQDDITEGTYPHFFVAGLAIGGPLGHVLIGGSLGFAIGLIVGGAIGKGLQALVTSHLEEESIDAVDDPEQDTNLPENNDHEPKVADWICQSCKKKNPGDFLLCWNCHEEKE